MSDREVALVTFRVMPDGEVQIVPGPEMMPEDMEMAGDMSVAVRDIFDRHQRSGALTVVGGEGA